MQVRDQRRASFVRFHDTDCWQAIVVSGLRPPPIFVVEEGVGIGPPLLRTSSADKHVAFYNMIHDHTDYITACPSPFSEKAFRHVYK